MVQNTQEQGRSLTEMLGVLAVIGVLSIGAVAGFKYAITKQKVGDTVYELEKRAVVVSTILMGNQEVLVGVPLETGMDVLTKLGYEITVQIPPQNEVYFEQTVENVPQSVCRQILKEYIKPALISVGGKTYQGDESICAAQEMPMHFYYKEDLTPKSPCAQKGFFDEASLSCKCMGNTYQDTVTGDCLCPVGHIWSAQEKTCVKSFCQEGYFPTLSNGCISCDDPNLYQITTDTQSVRLCQACPNRHFRNPYCPKNCSKGEIPNINGTCFKCDDPENAVFSPYDKEKCSECPNRYYTVNHCILNSYCNDGKHFIGLPDGYPNCISCDASEQYEVYTRLDSSGKIAELCRSCTNSQGVRNRDVVNSKCVRIVCNPDEFKGADGVCYPCKTAPNVAVNKDSGCETSACGRVIKEGMCVFDSCSSATHVQTGVGCFPCEMTTAFLSAKDECESSCTGVTAKRRWMGKEGAAEGYCRLNNCVKGVSYPYGNESVLVCYPCKQSGGVSLSAYGKEYCEACGNYVLEKAGRCIYPNACLKGEMFVSEAGGCVTCDTNSKINISAVPQQIEKCLVCDTVKRFYANEYCYRCDDLEDPFVGTEKERQSCLACGIRQIVGGKCILKQ